MSGRDSLRRFGAYAKALDLFDQVVADLRHLAGRPECNRLAAQQLASADSIAANIEEGFGRGTWKEYTQFLVIARGSAQETAGRYHRLRHWLSIDVVQTRVALRDEIIGILTATIKTLRSRQNSAK